MEKEQNQSSNVGLETLKTQIEGVGISWIKFDISKHTRLFERLKKKKKQGEDFKMKGVNDVRSIIIYGLHEMWSKIDYEKNQMLSDNLILLLAQVRCPKGGYVWLYEWLS